MDLKEKREGRKNAPLLESRKNLQEEWEYLSFLGGRWVPRSCPGAQVPQESCLSLVGACPIKSGLSNPSELWLQGAAVGQSPWLGLWWAVLLQGQGCEDGR